ncbi:MAG: DUF4272 domain-containing protein [Thermodesulfobacteriota bacterium]
MGTHADFMRLWTQSDSQMERIMGMSLLDSLDTAVQAKSNVLSRLSRGRPASGPVVRWLEEWAYPAAVTARLNGDSMVFSGHLFGRVADANSIRMAVREGTILERFPDIHESPWPWIRNLTLRSKSEILDASDLIYRLHWATRQAQVHGDPTPPGVHAEVVEEWHHAVNWLTN